MDDGTKQWVYVCHPPTGGPLYWCRHAGWMRREKCTVFSDEERQHYKPAFAGMWIPSDHKEPPQ